MAVALVSARYLLAGELPPVGLTLIAGGLGLDIAGVWILTRGVFVSDQEIARVGTIEYLGGTDQRRQIEQNRANGYVGLHAALVGFVLQLAGLVLGV